MSERWMHKFMELGGKVAADFERVVVLGNRIIQECRTSPQSPELQELNPQQKARLAKMEKGWENDPDAVAEIMTVLGRPEKRAIVELMIRSRQLFQPFP
jgi:hypothetical protein